MTALCECGCGRRAPSGRRYVTSHKFRRGSLDDLAVQDNLAIARFTGAADARNGRPRRVDLADRGPIGAAYHRGYDNPDAWRYER